MVSSKKSSHKLIRWLLGLIVLAVSVGTFWMLNNPAQEPPSTPDMTSPLGFKVTEGAAAGYIEDRACATCHPDLFASYQEVGMARSFSRPRAENLIEDFENNHFYHEPSQRHYEMIWRDGKMFFKRYQVDDAGVPINVFERQVDWIVGSGYRTRSYLYQTETGELFQLPVGWYSQSKQWGMAPGYDKPHHEEIQRPIRQECMFCHNAFPDVPEGSDVLWAAQSFPKDLPEGTGCQRCHGPGAEHVRTVLTSGGDVERIRAAIVNPRRLPPERRDAVCFQCHLLPAVSMMGVRRYDRDVYSFRPGELLEDYMLHVDVDEQGQARPDRFEINHHAYRFRQSQCYQESEGAFTCISCHNPHRKVPPEEKVSHYGAVCRNCHEAHPAVPSPIKAAPEDCLSCHMPARRTQDVVNVIMTDHNIQRAPGGADLLAPRQEVEPVIEHVDFLRAERSPDGPLGDVYLASTTLRTMPSEAAVDILEEMLPVVQPQAVAPYFDLAQGQIKLQRFVEAEKTLRAILKDHPQHPQATLWLGIALTGQQKNEEAVGLFRTVLGNAALTSEAHFNLGLLLVDQKRHAEAEVHLRKALEIRPNMPKGWLYLARTSAAQGRFDEAIAHYQQALSIDPALTLAYLELGFALMQQGKKTEALRYWQHGVKASADPTLITETLAQIAQSSN